VALVAPVDCVSPLQITEDLEKIKQEMEERGSSMTDGGKKNGGKTLTYP